MNDEARRNAQRQRERDLINMDVFLGVIPGQRWPSESQGTVCDRWKQRLPQRFRWVSAGYSRWKYGVCLYNWTHDLWEIHTFGLLEMTIFDTCPEDMLSALIGDVDRFEWLDDDFRWPVIGKQAKHEDSGLASAIAGEEKRSTETADQAGSVPASGEVSGNPTAG